MSAEPPKCDTKRGKGKDGKDGKKAKATAAELSALTAMHAVRFDRMRTIRPDGYALDDALPLLVTSFGEVAAYTTCPLHTAENELFTVCTKCRST